MRILKLYLWIFQVTKNVGQMRRSAIEYKLTVPWFTMSSNNLQHRITLSCQKRKKKKWHRPTSNVLRASTLLVKGAWTLCTDVAGQSGSSSLLLQETTLMWNTEHTWNPARRAGLWFYTTNLTQTQPSQSFTTWDVHKYLFRWHY